MPATPTAKLLLQKPAVGDTGWGTTTNGNWDLLDSLLSLSGTSNPTGVVTPNYINQYFIDTANAKAYVAKGLTNADWVLLNASTGSHHNVLINGAFDIWQRGINGTATAGVATYLADRFFVKPTTSNVTVSRSSSGRTGGKSRRSLQIDGVDGSTGIVEIGQRIEAAHVPRFYEDGFTVAVWVYNLNATEFTPTFSVAVPTLENNFGGLATVATLSPGIPCPVTTWTRIYATVSGAAFQAYSGIERGFQIELVVPTGIVIAGKTVRVTEFQLQEGSTLTTFLNRTIQEEWDACQRYYWKTYSEDVYPGATAAYGSRFVWSPSNGAAAGWSIDVRFPTRMVKTPTIVFYSPVTGAAGYGSAGLSSDTALTTTGDGQDSVGDAGCSVFNSSATGTNIHAHMVADAEL